jgi:hypothetical protein
MALFNYFLQLSIFSDQKASNSPNLSNLKWARSIQGVDAEKPASQAITVPAGQSVTVFTGAQKKFLFAEADKEVDLEINGTDTITLKPIVINNSTQPGQFLVSSTINELVLTNNGADDAEVFVASIE